MKYLLKFLPIFIFIIFSAVLATLFISNNQVQAASCSFSVNDTSIAPHGSFFLTLTGNVGTNYTISFSGSTTHLPTVLSSSPHTYPIDIDDLATINKVSGNFTVTVAGTFVPHPICNPNPLPSGGGNGIKITVGSGAVGSCTISTGSAKPGDTIHVTAIGLQNPVEHPVVNIDPDPNSGQPPYPISVHIGTLDYRPPGAGGSPRWEGDVTIPTDIDLHFEYWISVNPGDNHVIACTPELAIIGTIVESGKNPCAGGVCSTALGDFGGDLKSFSQRILTIGTGIAGSLALILMVIGSIRVLTSSGDQQKLNGGRDMIIAAVTGLLFIIFSVLILQFIGVNILGLS